VSKLANIPVKKNSPVHWGRTGQTKQTHERLRKYLGANIAVSN